MQTYERQSGFGNGRSTPRPGGHRFLADLPQTTARGKRIASGLHPLTSLSRDRADGWDRGGARPLWRPSIRQARDRKRREAIRLLGRPPSSGPAPGPASSRRRTRLVGNNRDRSAASRPGTSSDHRRHRVGTEHHPRSADPPIPMARVIKCSEGNT